MKSNFQSSVRSSCNEIISDPGISETSNFVQINSAHEYKAKV